MNPSKLAKLKPKKKCCKSRTRCGRCPVVVSKVRRASETGITGKELERVFKQSRKR
ncbi:MAG: hypothetical protein U0R77_00270 [Mycolicibacterium insubricum]